ncbi:heavy metal-responsive transcriptional regulator [Vampirovibrio sp.]|uniref:heavy metal-responsive transcriptional regulator n=1 Tax=Vampirovibrio sp. TaxID=2717857 RepID=UPI0035947FFC
MKPLSRKQVADAAKITIEAVRFYEKEALIAEPPRSQAGYRQYPADTVKRLRFIKRAQSLGFSLPEIRELLVLRVDPETTAANIRYRAQQKIQEIEQKIQALHAMKLALERITESCNGSGPATECPILEALDQELNERGTKYD